MFGFNKKCIVCNKEILKGTEIKKYGVYFCCPVCVGMYEKMLEDAKKMDLKNCC